MIRRRTVLAGLAGAALAAACSRDEQDPRVVVAYGTPTLGPVFERLNDIYVHNSVRIEGALSYDDLLRRNLLASYAGRLPHVSYDALCYLSRYVEKGLAVSLGQSDSLTGESATTAALAARIGAVEGQIYGAPFAVAVPLLYVNLELVERSGADPGRLPGDWEGLLELAARITRLGGICRGIYYDYDQTMAYAWQALLLSRGGRLVGPGGTVAFDSDAGLWAMRVLEGCGRAGQQDLTSESAQMSFAAGLIGIYFNTSSVLPRFAAQIANRFPLGVQPFPIPVPHGRLPAGGNCVILLADEGMRASARKWLDFSLSPVAQTVMGKGSGYLSLNDEANARTDLLGGYYATRPLYRAPLSQKALLTRWEVFPGPNGGRIANVLRDAMQSVIAGAIHPEEGLSLAARIARAYLKR
jgi:multiple sugar transport system substrate-binding protein